MNAFITESNVKDMASLSNEKLLTRAANLNWNDYGNIIRDHSQPKFQSVFFS